MLRISAIVPVIYQIIILWNGIIQDLSFVLDIAALGRFSAPMSSSRLGKKYEAN